MNSSSTPPTALFQASVTDNSAPLNLIIPHYSQPPEPFEHVSMALKARALWIQLDYRYKAYVELEAQLHELRERSETYPQAETAPSATADQLAAANTKLIELGGEVNQLRAEMATNMTRLNTKIADLKQQISALQTENAKLKKVDRPMSPIDLNDFYEEEKVTENVSCAPDPLALKIAKLEEELKQKDLSMHHMYYIFQGTDINQKGQLDLQTQLIQELKEKLAGAQQKIDSFQQKLCEKNNELTEARAQLASQSLIIRALKTAGTHALSSSSDSEFTADGLSPGLSPLSTKLSAPNPASKRRATEQLTNPKTKLVASAAITPTPANIATFYKQRPFAVGVPHPLPYQPADVIDLSSNETLDDVAIQRSGPR